ncbi:MAG: bifunctional oligoribonuclease/PAP phosphatase NrnA [Desulfobacterales bacterium]|nr:bifunctional oligoribonuclease/PAP phosphatase NrnA [Desulfobacterales bacterium]
MMDQIVQHLKSSGHVFIATHVEPDGDAIGSLLALGLAFESRGIKVTMYNESPIPAVYRFLSSVNRIVHDAAVVIDCDTAIILDCGNIHRIGRVAEKVSQIPFVINIDHHITNNGFGQLKYVDTSACATAEIIYRLIKLMDVTITGEMAASIYTGIMTDTSSFRFSNTNQAAFSICEEMIALGVKPNDIAKRVYGTYSLGRIKLLNLALDSIEISANGKLSMMTLTREMMDETETSSEDTDGLINYARNIEGVEVAVLIQENQNGYKKIRGSKRSTINVSLRSDGAVDVSRIAASFGGGGHISAAGFTANADTTLLGIKKKILGLAEQLWPR